jgi:hypothetical protein
MTQTSCAFARDPLAAAKADRSRTSIPPATRRVRALECLVERARVAIAVDSVAQIVEYEVAPFALACGAARGLALVDGALVVSLGIGRVDGGRRRRTKGILLRTPQVGHWAFEVTEVLSFVDVEKGAAPGALWIDAEEIVARASAQRDRSVGR